MQNVFVVISGAPGSGKSSLAKDLAPALGLPLLMKDTVKEAIADILGAPTREDSKRLGAATMRVLYALARDNSGAVLESTWVRELSSAELAELGQPVVEVFVDVPVPEAIRRYRERAGTRHPVHFDHDVDEAAFAERARPVDGGWPVIRVDGTQPIDVDELVQRISGAGTSR